MPTRKSQITLPPIESLPRVPRGSLSSRSSCLLLTAHCPRFKSTLDKTHRILSTTHVIPNTIFRPKQKPPATKFRHFAPWIDFHKTRTNRPNLRSQICLPLPILHSFTPRPHSLCFLLFQSLPLMSPGFLASL